MSFVETIERARSLLERNGRLSLRAVKREFALDDEVLDELVDELVDVQQVAALEGKVLAWIGSASDAESPVAAAEGERRQLTVLFCDLVGSTELAARLDPEDWHEVLSRYQSVAGEIVDRHGGHVAQYLGDGLLVYFGWPKAWDDAAERAVRAGLGLVDAAAGVEADSAPLAVRVGIHTGPVVVSAIGDEGRSETLALGDVPNVASRVQSVAEPGTVLISRATQRLVAGLFVIEERGARRLKGVAEPMVVHRVVQPSGVRSGLRIAARHHAPFVGRRTELGVLVDAWAQVIESRGCTVLVEGEAGLGKSRLCYELKQQLEGAPHTWLECRCSPYTTATAFHPIVELLEQALAFRPNDSPAAKLKKLAAGLARAGLDTDEAVPLLAEWLGLPESAGYTPLALAADSKRSRIFETLVTWNLRLSELQPLVALVEDLHWCDPSSIELLGRLMAQSATARVLLVGTARPEFENPWSDRSRLQTIRLRPLTRSQTRELVTVVGGGHGLPESAIDQLVERADGVPLFAEELAQSASEAADAGSVETIPATLQDSLLARLDRLATAKEVAQRASVLGRDFGYALLQATAGLDERALREGLGRLVEGELLFARGEPPEATYTFKHALVQQAAYESLLKRTRQQLHGRVADVLGADPAAQPELLALHAEAAGRLLDAIAAFERAGEQARARSAHEEAISHQRRAIALVTSQPEGRERDLREAALQLMLGGSLCAARGYAHPEVGVASERARVLFEAIGDAQGLGWSLVELANHAFNSGWIGRAVELATRSIAIAQQISFPDLERRGRYQLAQAEFFRGRLAPSLAEFEAARVRREAAQRDDELQLEGGSITDREVALLCSWSWSLGLFGRVDQSLARVREGVARARRLGHPHSLCLALDYEAVVCWLRRETPVLRERAAEAMEVAESHGFPVWLGLARTLRAAAAIQEGDTRSVDELLSGLTESGAGGSRSGAPALFVFVGAALLAAGEFERAHGVIDGGFSISEQTGQPVMDGELHRLRGALEIAAGGADGDAEAHFQRSLEIARAQEARAIELRAATSLARLWQQQGKRDEAHALLRPVYDWFTEGLDTQDLKDAKTLLEDLS